MASANMQWLFNSGEQIVVHGPLVKMIDKLDIVNYRKMVVVNIFLSFHSVKIAATHFT